MFCKKSVIVVLLIFMQLPLSLFANDDSAWESLREGNAVAIMRHAIAPHSGAASELTRPSCLAERNLSQSGRQQAIKIGDMFRANSVQEAKVYTSSLCRCVDTGTLLGFGQTVLLPAIDSFFDDFAKAPQQTADLTEWIKHTISQQQANTILVTHGYNISHLLGHNVAQGDVLIVGLAGDRLIKLSQLSTRAP